MTADIAARGLLERHCGIGKTPLLAASLCKRRLACQNDRAGEPVCTPLTVPRDLRIPHG